MKKPNCTKTQTKIILRLLLAAKGRWVGLPKLAKASGSLSPATRISNLRKQGWDIRNDLDNGTRPKRSSYRLIQPDPCK